jgi:hypothetical protein
VIHPAQWAAGALVALVVAVRPASGPWGWAAAVILTVAANPRLLVYQLMALVAALGSPRPTGDQAAMASSAAVDSSSGAG